MDKSITIAASPARVFAWLAPARIPSWDESVVRMAPRAQEDRFERVVRAQGHRFAMDVETMEEPDRGIAWRQVAGDFAANAGAIELERVGDGTRVRLVADVEYPYQMPHLVTEDALRRELSDSLDRALFNLKALVEAHGAS